MKTPGVVGGGRSERSKVEVTIFVPCVSDHESGSPKVVIVAGQPRPGICSLPHTGVNGTERRAKRGKWGVGWGGG